MSKYLFVKYLLISKQTVTQVELFKKLIFGGSVWGVPRRVASPNYVKIFVCYISADIIKHWHSKLSCSKNWFLGGPFGGSPGGWHPQTMSKYLSVKYLLISKKSRTLPWAVQKTDFWGVHLGGPWGVGIPKLCQNICLLNIYWYQKKVELYLEPFKKLIFGGSIWGVPGGVAPPNYVKIFVC